jgi:hypothetical protein
MSTWCLDQSLFISDLDSVDRRSTLSTRFCVPHHPAEQGIAQTREDIESTLKGHALTKGPITTPSFCFEYIVVGKCPRLMWRRC